MSVVSVWKEGHLSDREAEPTRRSLSTLGMNHSGKGNSQKVMSMERWMSQVGDKSQESCPKGSYPPCVYFLRPWGLTLLYAT